jgi:hypothetical protein
MVDGVWYKLSWYVKLNTSGSANGIARAWINDVLQFEYTDVELRKNGGGAESNWGTRNFWLSNLLPIWGGHGETKDQSDFFYMDHAIISTTPIGGGADDTSRPYSSQWSPTKSSVGVAKTNRTISFHVQDGVDVLTSNGVVNIEGADYTCSAGLICTGNGTNDVSVTFTKSSDWSYGQVVNVSTSGFRDSAGNIMSTDIWQYTIVSDPVPLAITTSTLPGGALSAPYSQTVYATGGKEPYTFSKPSGSLPTGLSLSSAGVITGTTTTLGMFNFTVRVTDALSVIDDQALSIIVFAAGNMSVINGRYFTDASGTPKFLIGYCDQSAGHTGTSDAYTLKQIADAIGPYGLNYMRALVSQYRYTATTSPPSSDGLTSHTPFLYQGDKANMNQWDDTYWTNLRSDVENAAGQGIFMHLSVFDGYGITDSNPAAYRWSNSDWNLANQTTSFYGNVDTNSDGDAADSNEFCNTAAFTASTGIGYYQKRLIDKLIAEIDGYNNVFYEVGNEFTTSTCPTWATAVRNYMITKTSKPVTINTCYEGSGGCTMPSSTGGWVSHIGASPADVKTKVASIVGKGYPAMLDPDGSILQHGSADDLRKAAWYSLTGGAFGWGGFSSDWWSFGGYGGGLQMAKATYYGYIPQFLANNAVQFWDMSPQHSLISTNTTNSLLAKIGSQYLGYVLSGASVNITLGAGSYSVKYFDPVTGVTTTGTVTTGPATRTFNRPAGAADWVVFVYSATAPVYVTTTSLPSGTKGTAYFQTLTATGGIPSPYTWAIISGVLPSGLNFSQSGVISGTPTVIGTYPITVTATDNSANTGTKALTLYVADDSVLVTVSISAIQDTFINSGSPFTNYSSNIYTEVYQWPHYTVANRILDNIVLGLPNNATIVSATLYKYMESVDGFAGTDPMRLFAQRSSPQNISTVTWATFDNVMQAYESFTEVGKIPGWVSFDVTAMTAWAYANASPLYVSISGMQDGVADTNRIFTSIEGTTNKRPYLVVVYTQSALHRVRAIRFRGWFR